MASVIYLDKSMDRSGSCVRKRDPCGIISVNFGQGVLYRIGRQLCEFCATPFGNRLIEEGVSLVKYAADFFLLKLDTQHYNWQVISFHCIPRLPKLTVCDTIRLHTLFFFFFLCSYKFCFLHFSSVSPFHSNTSVNRMHFLVSIIFFVLVLCYFFLY